MTQVLFQECMLPPYVCQWRLVTHSEFDFRDVTAYPVESKEQNQESSAEEHHSDIIQLLEKLPFRLVVVGVLCFERRGMVEEK
jgi:hypothetical protein